MKHCRQIVFLLAVSVGCDGFAAGWNSVSDPTLGKPRAIGTYTAGCLAGGAALPPDGPGFQVMRPSRRRHFGHPHLVQFVRALGQEVQRRGWGTLLIGDLGQARGGPTPFGHRSHQTGLDVDIWFDHLPAKAPPRLSTTERERRSARSVVAEDRLSLRPDVWQPEHASILSLATEFPEVERIFVNAAIKRRLCNQGAPRRVLNKLRPWWAHDDHFHVRLRCPAGDSECSSQDPVPVGDGCDASLDWWLSPEARFVTPGKSAPPNPVLPPECRSVLLTPR